MRNNSAKSVALGGMLAAAALVIMCLGGMIPLATYICPMLCILAQFLVLRFCGKRIAWAWYAVVSLLSLLLGPDKEVAAVFVLLGYYPIIKPRLDTARLGALWKLLLFNTAILVLYTVLIRFLGIEDVMSESEELGILGLMILLVMGNVTFLLLDKVLNMLDKKFGVRKWKSNGSSTS